MQFHPVVVSSLLIEFDSAAAGGAVEDARNGDAGRRRIGFDGIAVPVGGYGGVPADRDGGRGSAIDIDAVAVLPSALPLAVMLVRRCRC
ncbi:hypothetical protein AUC71_11370 [Methyloceanibacter marginalis]|uniref:Uncharacterized protein n=1 Tax=Methyloceanibacter marginalis TaxID=1774971 RepID=A0A1E3WBD2_9HYPH|nr:hypothetical protein AUC71_11370 [Methyloceanibacter marginalis]